MPQSERLCDQCGAVVPNAESRFCNMCGAEVGISDDRPEVEQPKSVTNDWDLLWAYLFLLVGAGILILVVRWLKTAMDSSVS